MIEISQTQADLIRAFLKPSKDEKERKKGLSSLDLKKRGANRKTFDNHRGFLQNNGLIITSLSEEHYPQIWNYYQLTAMGLLTFFHHAKDVEIKKIMKHHDRFFPLIAKHWDKISKMYGMYISDILHRTVDSFDVDIKIYVGEKKGSEAPLYVNPSSTTTLRFQDFHVLLNKEIGFNPFEKTKYEEDVAVNFKKFADVISREFTFIFYFYLLSLPFEHEEKSIIWWKHHATFQNNTLTIRGKGKDHVESSNQFLEKVKDNSIKILSIIKKDKELSEIFVEWLDVIDKKFQKPKIISDLQEEIK